MEISFKTAQQETTWQQLETVWRAVDDIEVYSGGWLFDHFYPLWTDSSLPCMEAWSTAAALAAVTQRLRIGHLVTSNTYRHPALVANTIATVDLISNGRLDFGFGAGWFEEEHDAYGIPLPGLTERFDRFEEAIEVIDLLLTQRQSSYDGRYYQLQNAYCEPKPVQSPRPPLAIGGKGEKRLLKAAAQWADHYNYPADDIDDFRYRLEVLDQWCDELGRDPSSIVRSLQVWVKDADQALDTAHRAVEAGATHLVFYVKPPHELALLEEIANGAGDLTG